VVVGCLVVVCLTDGDACRGRLHTAFSGSCQNGHREIAQWLVTATFKPTKKDVHVSSSFALSCESEHLEIAQWLVSTFGLAARFLTFVKMDTLPLSIPVRMGTSPLSLISLHSSEPEQHRLSRHVKGVCY
jgi:hypothetical protein